MITTLKQLLVLLSVWSLGDDSYGVNVASLLMKITESHKKRDYGIYVTLHRLRDKELLQQWVGGPGGSRPYYSLTPLGAKAVRQSLDDLHRASELVEALKFRIVEKRVEKSAHMSV